MLAKWSQVRDNGIGSEKLGGVDKFHRNILSSLAPNFIGSVPTSDTIPLWWTTTGE